MPLQRLALSTTIFFIGLMLTSSSHAQLTRAGERAMIKKGTDSAWIFYPRFHFGRIYNHGEGRARYFLGDTRVSAFEFESSLRESDPEVEALIDGAYNKFKVGRIFSLIGGLTGVTGFLWLLSKLIWYNSPTNLTGPLILIGTSVVSESISVRFFSEANNRFEKGTRVFNKKVKEGTMQNAQLQVGFTGNGLGARLRF